jgi:hypothetical protein
MLQDRFDRQDEILADIQKNLREHVEVDQEYWKKIDVTEGNVDLLKWLFGSTLTTLVGSGIAWIITHLKG